MTTKQYLRFQPSSTFGIIASSTAKILHLDLNKKCNSVVVPAGENVIVWNLQTKEKSLILSGESSYVTCVMYDDNFRHIAVGYANGVIRIFDVRSGSCIVSFCGHKAAVSCLTYDTGSLNLVSGGKDSEIVVWNVTDQAGLFRLKGHKGPITKCQFFKERNILISSSKDTLIKFWDLDTQHCFQTLVGMKAEILDFVIIKDTRLITGTNGPEMIVRDLLGNEDETPIDTLKRMRLDTSDKDDTGEENVTKNALEMTDDDDDEKFKFVEVGKLLPPGDKTSSLVVDRTERLLGCHASTKVLQLYKILNSEEIAKKLQKRRRKEAKKRNKEEDTQDTSVVSEHKHTLSDEFEALQPIRTNGKIDSFSITILKDNIAKISVLLKNNSIVQYQLDISNKNNVAELCHNVLLPGHRSMVRSLNYSSDSLSILSVSDESVKIWKKFQEDQVCTQTIACVAGLCSVFVSNSNHCIIGTKNGTLEIFDINSQALVEKLQSHDGAVNCICESPDQCGVASGSKDKSIKFWNYELLMDESYSKTKKKLSLTLKQTWQMHEEITCLKYSPDKKKIAVALLDNTVQVLFVDSFKLAFSLYGHLLPVACVDISYDSTLIATGSEDKDLRIWSMEFGDCKKFIKKAHEKGITCLNFLPNTHMFFTGGRDYAVKQWNADTFQKITTLKGHQNEITAMAVSPDGVTVATSSKDKSIRVWEKTQEPLILEEEQEKEEEEENEVEDLPVIPGEVNKEVALSGMKSIETIKSVEQLIEAIDVYKGEIWKMKEHQVECQREGKELPPPAFHPLLIACSATSPIRFMQKVVNRIKSSELEGTLLCLPFNYVLDFFKILCEFADRGWEVEFCERCSSFLVRIHMGQMISSQEFQPVVARLKEKLFPQVYKARDRIGFARTVCQLQLRTIDALEEVPVFTSVVEGLNKKKKKAKKKLERPVVAFS